MSSEDLYSTCAARTLLELGCRQCMRRKECINFKFKHNGVSPYEYKNSLKEDENNEKTE